MTTTAARKQHTKKRADTADIIILGYGSPDALHLTVDGQRILERAGRACALGVPPGLGRLLSRLRVRVVDLAERFDEIQPYPDTYLDIVDYIFDQTAVERPVVLLTPGNPLFLNSISRYLVFEGRRRDLRVDVHAGVSPLDVMISYFGIDVATFGLQVFTANGLVTRRAAPNPSVPLFVLEVLGLGADKSGPDGSDPDRYRFLVEHLGRAYPPQHRVTMVNLTAVPGRRSHATVALADFDKLLPHVAVNSHLFVDAVKATPRKES